MSSGSEPKKTPRPKPEEILASLRVTSQTIEAQFAKAAEDAAQQKAHTEGLKTYYFHRKLWSWFLIACIAVTLIFQIWLTISVGLGGLDFHEYAWFLPVVVTENFAQVIGLALIVVNFLFDKQSMGAWWKPSQPLGRIVTAGVTRDGA